MTSNEQVRRRRPIVYALSAVVLGVLAMGLVAALIISATAASRSAETAAATAKDFRDYRTDSEARSATAVADRAKLAEQNAQLQREIRALTQYLKDNGIDIPISIGTPPAAETSRPGSGTAAKPKSKPKPSTSGGGSGPVAPAPNPAPAPSSPAPSPAPTPLLCLPLLGCPLG